MATLPDDMLYYFTTTIGETFYFSVTYWPRINEIHVERIKMDELWELIMFGQLKREEISPAAFKFPLPANISGNVIAFVIK